MLAAHNVPKWRCEGKVNYEVIGFLVGFGKKGQCKKLPIVDKTLLLSDHGSLC